MADHGGRVLNRLDIRLYQTLNENGPLAPLGFKSMCTLVCSHFNVRIMATAAAKHRNGECTVHVNTQVTGHRYSTCKQRSRGKVTSKPFCYEHVVSIIIISTVFSFILLARQTCDLVKLF